MTDTGWQPIATAPRGGGHAPFLVSNNFRSRNAHGHMSHVWLVSMVHDCGDGEVVAFTENDRKIHGLTHWAPIPVPALAEQAA